jgi:hypothetical protein
MATTTRLRASEPLGALLLLTVALAACGGDTPLAPPPVDLSMLPALCDRLVAALERARPAEASVSGHVESPPVRTPVSDETTALCERIAALEAELAILRSRTFAGGSWMPRPVAIEPIRSEAVQDLSRQLAADRAREGVDGNDALRAVLLMQPTEVLARLGMPSETIYGDGWVKWAYRDSEQEVTLCFINGVVMSID